MIFEGTLKRPRKRPLQHRDRQESRNEMALRSSVIDDKRIPDAHVQDKEAQANLTPCCPSVTKECYVQSGQDVTNHDGKSVRKDLNKGRQLSSHPSININDLSFILHPAHDLPSGCSTY